MSINEIESKVQELRQLQALIEDAEAKAEAIKDAIKASMTAQGAEELRAGKYKITWKPVMSSRLDTSALKKTLSDVAERFTKTTTSRGFCVA